MWVLFMSTAFVVGYVLVFVVGAGLEYNKNKTKGR